MESNEIKEIIVNLKKEMPYKWRVQSFSKFKPQATCVAYIDSRDVQDMLDKSCVWSDRYYSEGGLLFCEITIYADGREYKRTDTGSESNVDKEKGHSSDAFKRAAVKFGVGRFLYSLGMKYLPANENKTNTNYPYVIDGSGKKVWDISKQINSQTKNTNPAQLPMPNIPRLEERLKACSTVEQLGNTYKTFTTSEKAATAKLTTELKEKLTKKAA
jgi:hypothetical protein